MNKYILIAVAVISFSGGWFVKNKIADARIAEINLETSKTLQSIAVTAASKQRELQDELDDKQRIWATVETEQYALLRDAENESDKLRADIAAGRKRLHVNATCPASSDNMPETGSSSSMDNGVAPRLTEDAEQAYHDLELGIARMTRQLLACQARL